MTDDSLPRRGPRTGLAVSHAARALESREEWDAVDDDHELNREADGSPMLHPWRLPKLPAPPPPRPNLTGDVHRERTAYVELLWRNLYSSGEIVDIVSSHPFFICEAATVKRALKEVRERYAKEEVDPLTMRTRKARLRSMIEGLYQDSMAARDRSSARYAANMLSKIDGAYAPIKHEISTNPVGLTLDAIVNAIGDDENALKAFEILVAKLEERGVRPAGDEVPVLEAGAIDAESVEK